jgi:hypothetical protein
MNWRKTAICKPEKEVSGDTNSVSTLIMDFLLSGRWKNKCLLFKSLSLWYFVCQSEQTITPAFTTSIQHTRSPSKSNQVRKRKKRHPNWKGRSKMILAHRWHDAADSFHKESIKILLKLIHQSRQIWNQYTKKSVTFVCTKNEQSEKGN